MPSIPLLKISLGVTLLGWVFSKEKKSIYFNWPISAFTLLWIWTAITTTIALVPKDANQQFFDFTQIFMISILTAFIIDTREKIHFLVWGFLISFFPHIMEMGIVGIISPGAKTGGGMRGTFFSSENTLARIIIISIPMFYYCFLQSNRIQVRLFLLCSAGLSGISLIVTGSRGGFVALGAMLAYFWLFSRHKMRLAVLGVAGAALVFAALPEARKQSWVDRMSTIETREDDSSFQARLRMWEWSMAMAKSRPITGGGFGVFALNVERMGNAEVARPAHSSYFEFLASHGYVGLGLYCFLGVVCMLSSFRTAKRASFVPELYWARDLMLCCQMFLVAYFVGGITANQGVYMPYYLVVAIIASTQRVVSQHLRSPVSTNRRSSPAAFVAS